MSAPRSPETPETPDPKGSSNPRTTAVAIGIGLATGVILIVWGRLFPPDTPEAQPAKPPPVVASAAPPPLPDGPSQYPLCEEIHDMFARAKSTHACTSDHWAVIRAVCEIAVAKRRDCEPLLKAAVACAKAAPQAGWDCDAKGEVELTACGPEQVALNKCLNP